MTLDIQTLIEQRPHLQNPLELYGKWQDFHRQVMALLPQDKPLLSSDGANTYAAESGGGIFQRFIGIFGLSEDDYSPLAKALEKGEIDFLRLSLNEVPAIADIPCSNEELGALLFLLARPYFISLRQAYPLDGSQWEHGRCPLCSAQAALSSVVEGPVRRLHCSFCGTYGPFRFIGCPNCGNTDPERLNSIVSDDEPGYRLSTCESCHTYVKVIDGSVLEKMSLDLADMASLPLDIIAQEKGYARTAPNPISLKKMV